MAIKDEQNTANTVPCSLMLTDDKIYVCHDESDNALIRQLDSVKLGHIAQLFVDPQCQYYCVLVSESCFCLNIFNFCFILKSIEHGNQSSKSWIFYFLFAKEMIQFVKVLQTVLSNTYQVPMDIHPLNDISFQHDCERTSKRLLRSYRPTQLAS
jgi:hypothetical protein